MKNNREQHHFTESTNEYSLVVTYIGQKLTLILEDYIQGIIYSRQYTRDDIGNEIHKKAQLSDLFDAFVSYKQYIDKKKIQTNQNKIGEIVYVDGNPCFKISHPGIVTVFVCLRKEKTTKQLVIWQSVLDLQKVGYIKHKGIQSVKQIRELQFKFFKKIQTLSQQNVILKNQNRQLKYQIKQVKQKYKALDNKLILTEKQLSQQIQKMNKNLTQMVQYQQMENRFAQLKQYFDMRLTNQKFIFDHQPQVKKDKYFGITTQAKLVKNHYQTPKKSMINSFGHIPNNVNDYSSYLNNFQITQSETSCCIKYIGENHRQTQFIFNKIIPYNHIFNFKIKIIKCTRDIFSNHSIKIGIVDETKQKNQRFSYNSGNAVCYDINGYKYPSGVKEGNGFREGQTVTVTVDLANKIICWSSAYNKKATHNIQSLSDKSRTFKPYVQMYSTEDIVEFFN